MTLCQLSEYGFAPGAADGKFRHNLVFMLRSQLYGRSAIQDLGGDVFRPPGLPPYLTPVSVLYPGVNTALMSSFCSGEN